MNMVLKLAKLWVRNQKKKKNAPDEVSSRSQKLVKLIKTQSISVHNFLFFSVFTLLNISKMEHWA